MTYKHIGKTLNYGETWLHGVRKTDLWIQKYGEDGENESDEVVSELNRVVEEPTKLDGHVKLFLFLKAYNVSQAYILSASY